MTGAWTEVSGLTEVLVNGVELKAGDLPEPISRAVEIMAVDSGKYQMILEEKFRCVEGETDFSMGVLLYGADHMESLSEIVFIGFWSDALGTMAWRRVNNSAPVERAAYEFQVDGMELKRVVAEFLENHNTFSIEQSRTTGAVTVTQGVDLAGVPSDWELKAIWHSHQSKIGPSKVDVEFFPTHLGVVGSVYHAPSGTTTLYNQDGEIFASQALQSESPSGAADG